MVVWNKDDVGKRTNICNCGGPVRIRKVRKKDIVKSCDSCSFTIEKHAETEVGA